MDSMALLLPAATFAAVVFLVLGFHQAFLAERARTHRRLAQYVSHTARDRDEIRIAPGESSILRERRFSTIPGLDRILRHRSFAADLALELGRAALPLRVGEYLLLRMALALTALIAAWLLTRYMLIGIGMGMVGYYLPAFYVRHLQQARIRRFSDQLVDTLSLMSNSLKSGYSFLQGMEAVAREMPPPASEEFGQALQDLRMGATVEEALHRMWERVPSDDLDMIITAILINRTAGGNLSEVLDNIAYTIRERIRIMREVRTLTAQERLSGYIIGALPVVLLVLISMLNPSYANTLLHTTSGQVMLAGAFILELIGFWMIKRILAIEV